ncbi:MAG: hypothetical protein ACOYB3_01315 [Azonexus sp.]
MNREQAKNMALTICVEWERQRQEQERLGFGNLGFGHRRYAARGRPRHDTFGKRLAALHFLCVTGVMTFMSIFLQLVDKKPRSLVISEVNWFYVAATTLAATVFAYRSYYRVFQHDTRPS